jgi:hypothetical protein
MMRMTAATMAIQAKSAKTTRRLLLISSPFLSAPRSPPRNRRAAGVGPISRRLKGPFFEQVRSRPMLSKKSKSNDAKNLANG